MYSRDLEVTHCIQRETGREMKLRGCNAMGCLIISPYQEREKEGKESGNRKLMDRGISHMAET